MEELKTHTHKHTHKNKTKLLQKYATDLRSVLQVKRQEEKGRSYKLNGTT